MSGATARRLIKTLTEHIEARDALMDALPDGTRIIITIQLGAGKQIKHVRLGTDSDISQENLLPGGSVRNSAR